MHARALPLFGVILVLACGGGDGDDGDGTDTDVGTGGGTTPITHGSNSSLTATSAMTFTNTTEPSDASVSVGDDDPSVGSSSVGDEGTSTTASVDSTGPMPTTTDTGEATTDDTGAPGGPCCSAQDGGGCGDAAVEACVCAMDDFCCRTAWDEVCTVQVVILGCADCPGIGGDGDCCAAHDGPGCDDDEVEACVCDMDYVCCLDPWDDLCADAAVECGGCPA
jgi:hypothetical protein